ncbi:hypothetical protein RI129_011950 [Pyrocoelia pectoralis]|uniref:Uncharacterized protein n=1 Tax=Pyrocoelia pectoralis TaxID=417401 RepID=A0AAN7ZHR5_9COLE
MEMTQPGCIHYNRMCKIMTPCCGKFYPCQMCHDMVENHCSVKYIIKIVKCIACNNVQPVKNNCDHCGLVFASYSCLRCFVLDSNPRGYFHCKECNVCKIGGRDNYFHCKTCHICLNNRLKDNHMCLVNCGLGCCMLCLTRVCDSVMPIHLPPCGHVLHEKCFYTLVSNNFPTCIACNSWLN